MTRATVLGVLDLSFNAEYEDLYNQSDHICISYNSFSLNVFYTEKLLW